jgi:hypothetical protein
MPYARIRNGRFPLGSFKKLSVDLRDQHPGSFRLSVLVEDLPGGDVEIAVVKVYRLQVLGCREFSEALLWEDSDDVG